MFGSVDRFFGSGSSSSLQVERRVSYLSRTIEPIVGRPMTLSYYGCERSSQEENSNFVEGHRRMVALFDDWMGLIMQKGKHYSIVFRDKGDSDQCQGRRENPSPDLKTLCVGTRFGLTFTRLRGVSETVYYYQSRGKGRSW